MSLKSGVCRKNSNVTDLSLISSSAQSLVSSIFPFAVCCCLVLLSVVQAYLSIDLMTVITDF